MRELKNPFISVILFIIGLASVIGLIISWGDSWDSGLTPNTRLRYPILGFIYFLEKLGVSNQYINLLLTFSISAIIFVTAIFLIRQRRLYYRLLGLLLLFTAVLLIFFGNKF